MNFFRNKYYITRFCNNLIIINFYINNNGSTDRLFELLDEAKKVLDGPVSAKAYKACAKKIQRFLK